MKVCILGVGSLECKQLEIRLRELLLELGEQTKVRISDDIDLFLKHRITKTPALLVDNQLVHNDQLSDDDFLKNILLEASTHDDNNHLES